MDMNTRETHSRILPPAIMAAWIGVFIYLLINGQYLLFLKPDFVFLILGGLAVTSLYLWGFIGKTLPIDKDHTVKGLFLLLPILFIFSAGENSLGSYTLSKRPMLHPETGLDRPFSSTPDTARPAAPPQTKSGLIPITRLIREWDAFEGKSVSIEGLFTGNVAGQDGLGAVFRYYVTCCAADAQPVGVFLKKTPDLDFEDNAWVRVTGTVNIMEREGFQVIFMDLEKIEPREKPSKNAAYLYN